jgi:peptidyl-prolyl cis-trans isomerase C
MLRPVHIAIALGATLGGCSDSERRAPVDTTPVTLEAEAAGRVVVATVDGHPIYDDCVITQMQARHLERRAALDECIDFELLARAAEARGYLDHPEVRATARTEAVRELMQKDFAVDHAAPSDIPDQVLRRLYDSDPHRWNHPEYRWAKYVRINVPKDVPRGSEADLEARRIAEAMKRALDAAARERKQRGDPFDPDDFARIAAETAYEVAGVGIATEKPVNFPKRGRMVPEFADAAFAIPEVGLVSEVTRTDWGWDLLLLVDILPAEDISFEEAKDRLREMAFEVWQVSEFRKWAAAASAGTPVEVDEQALESLASAGDAPLPEAAP